MNKAATIAKRKTNPRKYAARIFFPVIMLKIIYQLLSIVRMQACNLNNHLQTVYDSICVLQDQAKHIMDRRCIIGRLYVLFTYRIIMFLSMLYSVNNCVINGYGCAL